MDGKDRSFGDPSKQTNVGWQKKLYQWDDIIVFVWYQSDGANILIHYVTVNRLRYASGPVLPSHPLH